MPDLRGGAEAAVPRECGGKLRTRGLSWETRMCAAGVWMGTSLGSSQQTCVPLLNLICCHLSPLL